MIGWEPIDGRIIGVRPHDFGGFSQTQGILETPYYFLSERPRLFHLMYTYQKRLIN